MEFKVFKNENNKILKEYWLTPSEWDALDKTTVQEGDIYHIVGTIDKGDLSADVNASLAKGDSSLQKPTATLAKESFVKVGIDGSQKFDESSYAALDADKTNVFNSANTFNQPVKLAEGTSYIEYGEQSSYKFRDNSNENVLATLGDISSASVAIEDESKTYITFKGSKFPSETRTIRANAGTVIDWGDGSVNTYTQQNDAVTHTYTDGSDYHKITLSGWTDLSGGPFTGDGFIDVIIGNNVTTIPAALFTDCPNLVSVTLPKSITTIEDSLFYACPKLEKLKILATTPPTLGNNPFENTRPRIIVPAGAGTMALYKTADGWSDYSSRIVYEINYSSQLINKFSLSGESGTLTDIQYKRIVTLQSGMTIVHSGIYYNLQNIPSNSSDDYIFTSTYYTADDAKLATGIITVKNDKTWTWTSKSVALTSSVSDNLNTLEAKLNENIIKDPSKTYLVWKGNKFPNSDDAKFKAPAGSTVDWGDGDVETFVNESTEVNTHTYTDGVEYHLIAISGITSIDSQAFLNCSGLMSVTIGNGVTSIGEGAFYGCSGLMSVTIGNGVTSIGEKMFDGCSGLTSVTIPDSVISIGDEAFRDCRGLMSVTIPDSVTSIGSSAFEYCRGLMSVTIPDSVTIIGSYAFYDCSGLKKVIIKATSVPTLDAAAIPATIEKIIVPKSAINAYKSAAGWSTYADKIVYEVDSSDISDTSNFAKLSENNTFSGRNTFAGSFAIRPAGIINGQIFVNIKESTKAEIVVNANPSTTTTYGAYNISRTGYGDNDITTTTFELPIKDSNTYTIATTADIPIKSASLDGTTLNITLA